MKITHVIITSIILVLLAGCGASQTPPTQTPMPPTPTLASPFPMTVQDSVGNQVTIKAEPQRIISLVPGHTETLYALGLGERVVGVTEYCNYPPEAQEKPKVGGFADVNMEQVVGLQPDLVLASTLHMAEIVPALQERGITVFVAEPDSVAKTLEMIATIGRITGQDQQAQTLVNQMQQRIDAVQAKIKDAPRPKIFWELGAELYTAGPGSFLDDLITLAGGENIAADAGTAWPQLSLEVIVLQDPDVVVLADHNYGETIETVKSRPGWDKLKAVQQGRVIELTNDDIVSRQGPRIVEGLEFLAQAFHPDLFN